MPQNGYKERFCEACVQIVQLQEMLKRERRMRMAAQRRSTTDVLTHLMSRRAFAMEGKSLFKRAMTGRESAAFFFIDLNFFKQVNDDFGHAVGDELLTATANVLKNNKRPSDLAGRFGGDEFVLFLTNVDETGARIVAMRMIEAVAAIRLPQHQQLRPSISVGVAVGIIPLKVKWTDLQKQADHAMYEAKKMRGMEQPTLCIKPIVES